MQVIIDKKVSKNMDRFPPYVREQVLETLILLEKFPLITADIKKLGRGTYRIRRGKYRILFHVESDIIVVFEIDIRGRISYAKG